MGWKLAFTDKTKQTYEYWSLSHEDKSHVSGLGLVKFELYKSESAKKNDGAKPILELNIKYGDGDITDNGVTSQLDFASRFKNQLLGGIYTNMASFTFIVQGQEVDFSTAEALI